MIDEIQALANKYKNGSQAERMASQVLFVLLASLMSGSIVELKDLCIEFGKYQVAVLKQIAQDFQKDYHDGHPIDED
jgi:hypothetical protein